MVSVNSDGPADLDVLENKAIWSEMPYLYNLRSSTAGWNELVQEESIVYLSDYSPDAIVLRPVGQLSSRTSQEKPLVRFESQQAGIGLLSAAASRKEQDAAIELTWQAEKSIPEHLTVFAHVVDASGQLSGQIDGDPLGGSYPLSQWAPGQIVIDHRSVNIDGTTRALIVGVYNRLDGERLEAILAEGSPSPDNALAITVE